MHCGFESASIYETFENPLTALKMIRSGAVKHSGIGAS
jgi:hypothetical protein